MELPTSSCHGVLHPRYYGPVGNFSRKPPGTPPGGVPEEEYYRALGYGGDVIGGYTSDWYRMSNRTPPTTGGLATHTHTKQGIITQTPGTILPGNPYVRASFLLHREIAAAIQEINAPAADIPMESIETMTPSWKAMEHHHCAEDTPRPRHCGTNPPIPHLPCLQQTRATHLQGYGQTCS